MKNAIIPALAAAALALAAGCASRIPAGQPAYVYVTGNGVVTFRGEPLKASDLPERLKKAGAKPQTQIFIVAQGDVPSAFLTQLAVECGRAGLPECVIRERRKVVVEGNSAIIHSVGAETHEDRPEVNVGHSAQ